MLQIILANFSCLGPLSNVSNNRFKVGIDKQ